MIGRKLSHYKILGKLGRGGMGEVYRAEDTNLKRQVALKVLPASLAASHEHLKRFQREAKTLAALDHPGIVSIYSLEQADGVRFITMQLVEGKTLSELIPRGGMSLEKIFEIAIQVADALAAAHERGVIHRDLKPGNLMITDAGQLKVLDFGLAMPRHEAAPDEVTELATEPLTEEGRILGTVPYMSPEQVEGKALDSRSDIFSLGVLLYEMATGERPFRGETSVSLVSSIVKDTPREVDLVRAEAPHHLARIIRQCLEKAPEDRFQTARDVHNQLRRLQDELASAEVGPATVHQGKVRDTRRRRPWALVAGVAAITLAAAAGFWAVRQRAARPTAGTQAIRSLAVLPFDNLSREPDQEYFADGMTQALITDLSKIAALRVISRTSVMRYKNSEKALPEIARELGVDALVEGSVERFQARVRITAQLIGARTDTNLWGERYDREEQDVLQLQSEVARDIARQIEIAVTPEEASRLTAPQAVDPATYDLYLKARFHLDKFTPEGTEQGLAYLHQAVQEDPAAPFLYAGLALGYTRLFPLQENLPRARAAALKALALDESLADAHLALALASLYHGWDWAEAEQSLRRALDLNPNSAEAHRHHAWYLVLAERDEEAFAAMRRATEVDPLPRASITAELGWLYWGAGRLEEAEAEARKSLEEDPDLVIGLYVLGSVQADEGRYEDAMATHERLVAVLSSWRWALARTYARAGRLMEARDLLALAEEQANPENPWTAWGLAEAHAALGENDAALRWLEAAYEDRNPWLPWLGRSVNFDPLRGDPRFEDLLLRMNLPP